MNIKQPMQMIEMIEADSTNGCGKNGKSLVDGGYGMFLIKFYLIIINLNCYLFE